MKPEFILKAIKFGLEVAAGTMAIMATDLLYDKFVRGEASPVMVAVVPDARDMADDEGFVIGDCGCRSRG